MSWKYLCFVILITALSMNRLLMHERLMLSRELIKNDRWLFLASIHAMKEGLNYVHNSINKLSLLSLLKRQTLAI